MTRRLATLLVAATLALTSCASLTPESLPITGDRNGYDVTLEFASVLNLANRAQVVLDGVPVGVVTGMRLTGAAVRVTVRLDEGVVAPGDIEAVLRQPTVLGDIVVALINEETATLKRFSKKGGSIALEAANPAFGTQIFGPDRVRIQGKLVALVRKYH